MFKPTSILFTQKTNLKNATINIDTNNTLNTSIKKGDTDHLSKYKSYLKNISTKLNNSVNKNTGKVLSIKDGVAFVSGLSSVKMGEMVDFTRTHTKGMALNLEGDKVGCIVFGDDRDILQDDPVVGLTN